MAPFVSVIIPTYCRPRQLSGCLKALTNVDYDKDDFEVIVVDDGSSMALEPVLRPFQSSLNLTLIRQKNQGPAAARNTGVEAAAGEVIAFIDDDCYPDSAWLKNLVEAIGDDRSLLVGGRIVNSLVKNQFSETSQLLTEYLYDYYSQHNQQRRFFTSNNMACYADTFRALGGFCQQYFSYVSEDRDLSNRWTQAGYKLHYAPDALVFHAHDLSFGAFLKQHFFYGQGAFAFHKVRAYGGTPKLEPTSFYRNLILSPFSRREDNQLILASYLVLAQAANASGFFYALGRNLRQPRSYRRDTIIPLQKSAKVQPTRSSNAVGSSV